jgi:exodeoxyribonuclease V alpha subunit
VAQPDPSAPGESLEGTLARVIFEHADRPWRVVRMDTALGEVTAVGNLSGLAPGEPVRLTGRWVDNPKFGRQFQADSFVPVRPGTVEGIERYLGWGLVDGIGPGLAKRLVAHFGPETLEVIEAHPERLTEVEGIGPVRAERIQTAWQGARHLKEVMVFLQSLDVGTGFALRIFRRYGERAVQVVKSNPYQLALDVSGVGFLTADRIARSLGLAADDPARLAAGLLHALGEASEEGHVHLPGPELSARAAALLGVSEDALLAPRDRLALGGYIQVEPHGVSLARLYEAERKVAAGLARVLAGPRPARDVDADAAVAEYEAQSGLTLADQQRAAVKAALRSKLLVITGGPGTGKTTIVKGVLRILEAHHTTILLAAPTGRAAKRMSEATGREAKTLHRLLEYAPQDEGFLRSEDNPLEGDVVIVDEASMVDILLMQSLVAALPDRAQLILVGDVDQLPSVGPGAVLHDVIRSGRADVVRLTRIYRQAHTSLIVENAHRINHGELPVLPAPGDPRSDFYLFERDAPEDVLRTIEELVKARIPRGFGLDPVDQVQVLTPMHKGPLGAQNLNQRLQALLNPSGPELARGQVTLRQGDKVMQTKNDYDLGVFNGDVGRVLRVDPEEKALTVDYEGREVVYDAPALEQLQLAYATSIHKSQGSEYPAVVVPVSTQHFVMLHRNLLYTAITRGKRLVILVGSKKALAMAVKSVRDQRRYTALADRLLTA